MENKDNMLGIKNIKFNNLSTEQSILVEKNMECLEMAKILIPEHVPSIEDVLSRYPERNLPENAKVVRIAPSPTGFAHFGLIYTAMINRQIAYQSEGVFFIRIEDTDKKREVERGTEKLLEALKSFDIDFQEGPTLDGNEIGNYGPYIQSKRSEIYLSATRELIERGFAYPCFCSEEKLNKVRSIQEANKKRTGYYGEYAECRNLSLKQVKEKIDAGESYTIRFRSPQNSSSSTFSDSIKGDISLPTNDVDYVLVKSAGKTLGLPVYHLAAMVDDHLQKVNLVIRGDEWLPSLSLHLQIIDAFGWKRPDFGHLSPVMKIEGETTKRKLSKRKDPEAAASFYLEQGIPSQAVRAYVLNLADSTFEDWRRANSTESLDQFPFMLSHMNSGSGALFDMVKFLDICKQEISVMSAEEIYNKSLVWARTFNQSFYKLISENKNYAINIFNIERDGDNPRKDISQWSELPDLFGYFFDEVYDSLSVELRSDHVKDNKSANAIIMTFLDSYSPIDNRDQWLGKLRNVCTKLGYAPTTKDYKNDSSRYIGSLGDVAMIIRIALSGRTKAPDLYSMMQTMGYERTKSRLKKQLL